MLYSVFIAHFRKPSIVRQYLLGILYPTANGFYSVCNILFPVLGVTEIRRIQNTFTKYLKSDIFHFFICERITEGIATTAIKTRHTRFYRTFVNLALFPVCVFCGNAKRIFIVFCIFYLI